MLSRVVGFAREWLCARFIGAGAQMDAFYVAFMIPNLLRRLFAEGAFSQAYVPILAEYKNQKGLDATRALVDRVATLLCLVVLVVSVLGILFAPTIVDFVADGYRYDTERPYKFALTVELTRITFPYILLITMVSLSAGILNTWNRFSIPAFPPVLLNLCMITVTLIGAAYLDSWGQKEITPEILNQHIRFVAWGALIGGAAQLILQIIPLKTIGMLPRPKFDPTFPGVRRILALMGPAVIGVSVSQISLLINTKIASHLPTGSVSWMTYGDRLFEVPAGVLGAALGTILLPSLSKLHASQRHEDFSAQLDWGLRITLLLALPATVGLVMLGTPLISTCFQYGQFAASAVAPTRNALIGYSVGLTAMILIKVLAPSFYARQDMRTPVKIAILSLVATQILNLFFVGMGHPLVATVLGSGARTGWLSTLFSSPLAHAGLALSIGVTAYLNAGLLYVGLRRRKLYLPQPGWPRFLIQVLAAIAVMGAVLWFGSAEDAVWLARSGLQRVLWLLMIVIAGATSYFAVLFALGIRLKDFKRRAID